MVCEEEHHAGDSVDESHSTGTEVEARVSCFEISAFACICVPQLCVLPQSTGLSPRCKKWVSKCETKGQKLWARTEKVSVPLEQTVPVNLQKTVCLSRSTHGHESKSKRNE